MFHYEIHTPLLVLRINTVWYKDIIYSFYEVLVDGLWYFSPTNDCSSLSTRLR
jgi:hypothetical protein